MKVARTVWVGGKNRDKIKVLPINITMKATAKMNHKELELIKKVGKKLNIKVEKVTNFKMYDNSIVSGIAIYLPGWKYPAILTDKNELLTDTYNGAWGNEKHLSNFENEYAAENQRRHMRAFGVKWTEQKNENTGEIVMTIDC